ncbi:MULTISPECIES: hypothetical protein [unclassified Streptomyces]|uniref:RDD family protein n=1 Tax=Streptomyces sp. NBC_00060 TaxID=2975636 RepID=A0AAU2GTT3_9ACTN
MGDHEKPDDGQGDKLPGQPWTPPQEPPTTDGGAPGGGGKHGK